MSWHCIRAGLNPPVCPPRIRSTLIWLFYWPHPEEQKEALLVNPTTTTIMEGEWTEILIKWTRIRFRYYTETQATCFSLFPGSPLPRSALRFWVLLLPSMTIATEEVRRPSELIIIPPVDVGEARTNNNEWLQPNPSTAAEEDWRGSGGGTFLDYDRCCSFTFAVTAVVLAVQRCYIAPCLPIGYTQPLLNMPNMIHPVIGREIPWKTIKSPATPTFQCQAAYFFFYVPLFSCKDVEAATHFSISLQVTFNWLFTDVNAESINWFNVPRRSLRGLQGEFKNPLQFNCWRRRTTSIAAFFSDLCSTKRTSQFVYHHHSSIRTRGQLHCFPTMDHHTHLGCMKWITGYVKLNRGKQSPCHSLTAKEQQEKHSNL